MTTVELNQTNYIAILTIFFVSVFVLLYLIYLLYSHGIFEDVSHYFKMRKALRTKGADIFYLPTTGELDRITKGGYDGEIIWKRKK